MKLGAYTLIKKIAEGGVADIYLAKAKNKLGQDKYLICKCVRKNFSEDVEFLTSIINEVQLSTRLSHPNIINIFDLCSCDGNAFLTMEYLDAFNFQHLLKKNAELWDRVPYDIAIYAIGQAALGLHAAHELKDKFGNPLGLVHRDISPENILFGSNGDIKISDFGIAKTCKMPDITDGDVIKGKFNYMSPEQAWGDKLDRTSDLYSLAIVLYEAVLGQRFNPADDFDDAISRARMAFFELPANIDPDFPEDLSDVMLKALDLDRKLRFPTVLDFKLALDECAKNHHWNVSKNEWISYLKTHIDYPESRLPLLKAGEIAPDQTSILKPALAIDIGFVVDADATCQISQDDLLRLLRHEDILRVGKQPALDLPAEEDSGKTTVLMQPSFSDDKNISNDLDGNEGAKTSLLSQPSIFRMETIKANDEMKKAFSSTPSKSLPVSKLPDSIANLKLPPLSALDGGKTEAIVQPACFRTETSKEDKTKVAKPDPVNILESLKTDAVPKYDFLNDDPGIYDDSDEEDGQFKTEVSLDPIAPPGASISGDDADGQFKTEVSLNPVAHPDASKFSAMDSMEMKTTESALPIVPPANGDSKTPGNADISEHCDESEKFNGAVIVRKNENTGEFDVIQGNLVSGKFSRNVIIVIILAILAIVLVFLKFYLGE